MVVGRERNNWYADHPPACTCANCEAIRADRRRFEITTEGKKIGRNELCPCGSGKKYKRCHGNM